MIKSEYVKSICREYGWESLQQYSLAIICLLAPHGIFGLLTDMKIKEALRTVMDNQNMIIHSIVPNNLKEALLLHKAKVAAKTFRVVISKFLK